MAQFTPAAAADYNDRIRRLVPGYETLHQLVPALLADRLPPEARVLVVGAGTGQELVAMAGARPGWRFTALDPSAAMLDRARERAEAAGVAHRIVFVTGTAQDLENPDVGPHDAATSLLVLHFLAGDVAKTAYLDGIGRTLKPGAPLVLADLAAVDGFGPAYARWAGGQGIDAPAMMGRIAQNFHPLAPDRLDALLDRAGFAPARPFFQALAYLGVLTLKR